MAMSEQTIQRLKRATPVGEANAETGGVIAERAGLNRRSGGMRLNAIRAPWLKSRFDPSRGQNLWWRVIDGVVDAEVGPYPADDPIARLRHVVRAHSATPADAWAVDATSGVYLQGRTGLTFGDLRALEQAIRDDVVATLRKSGHLRS